ncbi:MAG: hypothetical protein CBC38_01715 [Gammaproteobacteria bacterium TMED78]|nr:MAG: hypothetical protein CBC38_01715 [Gammaproteobacteria bacterium TMED78]|tara:strand:+ start:229 stop:879 length:651 start_codon:yes stop_codon:yes gene_type:complete
MIARIRRYLIAGLLVWAPIGATIIVFLFLLDLMDRLLFLLPEKWRPEYLIGFSVPGLGAILALLVLMVTGVVVANFIGKSMVRFFESLLSKIPLVSTIYAGIKKFLELVFGDSHSAFERVLLIQYPSKGIYSICFQTSDNPKEAEYRVGKDLVTVFLPTTPNPTSGFMLMIPKENVTELEMPVEDALKMIISLGVVVPEWHPINPKNDVASSSYKP